jgi:glycosyltransferase involved in cell wall biosynthesis
MKVSILLVTYNQSMYIRQCMDGIVLQNLPIDTEIIVADDFSSDDTVAIIREYTDKITCKLSYLANEKNLGIVKNYQRAFAACSGQYIAVMEGDDYWTDPERINKHIAFLDNHHECVMTCNRIIYFNEDKNLFHTNDWIEASDFKYVTTQQMAMENKLGNLSACVFRKKEIDKIKPDLFDLRFADWMLGMVLGQFGFIAILKDAMSVYRVHNKGDWSKMPQQEQAVFMIGLIDDYNKYLGYKYDKEFTEHKQKLQQREELITGNRNTIQAFLPPFIVAIVKVIIPPFLQKRVKKN